MKHEISVILFILSTIQVKWISETPPPHPPPLPCWTSMSSEGSSLYAGSPPPALHYSTQVHHHCTDKGHGGVLLLTMASQIYGYWVYRKSNLPHTHTLARLEWMNDVGVIIGTVLLCYCGWIQVDIIIVIHLLDNYVAHDDLINCHWLVKHKIIIIIVTSKSIYLCNNSNSKTKTFSRPIGYEYAKPNSPSSDHTKKKVAED